MATVEEPRTFIRPDGKEKVTGTGRYTADLVLAGELTAKFRYADHTHARITRIDTTKARALPGVLAVVTHEDVPDVLYGGMVQGPPPLRAGTRCASRATSSPASRRRPRRSRSRRRR